MIKSFLGADTVDEWRPRTAACNWLDGGNDSASNDGSYAGYSEGGNYGGGFDNADSWSSYDTGGWNGGNQGGFDSGNQGFDNAGSWSSYNGADAPFGASYTSPGESLYGTGGFSPDSGFVNFNEGQSYPGYYDTSTGVANFNEGNPWGGVLSDISNVMTGGFAGGPVGWQGEFGAYGNMAGPSMGYANYAGNVIAPGLVGGFMDPGPFGMMGGQPGDYGPPGVFDAPPDARDPGQEMDQGGRTYFDPTTGGSMNPNGADPGAGMYNINNAPNDLLSSTQYNQSLGELAGQYGRNADAMSQLANGMNQYYADSLMSPAALDARDVGDQGRAGPLNQVSNIDAKGDFLGGYGRGGLDFANAFNANFNPNNLSLSPELQPAQIDPASLQATLPTVANMPWGQTAAGPYQGPFAGPDVVGNRQEAITLQEARGGIDPQQIQDAWNEAAGHRGESERSADIRGYDPARESLNEAGRALLNDAFQSRAGQEILQDQRDLQDNQRSPWTVAQPDLMPPTPWAYPTADPRSVEARGPQNIEYEYGNQNMGRPNAYPSLAEFLGPGRGQSQDMLAPSRGGAPLQVTVPGRVSESSRGVSGPFGGGQQQGGRGVQGQMDALLAQARTASTQAARIAALDALNGLISATYGRGPNQSVGRGPYGGDPDPFIAQMLRMGR